MSGDDPVARAASRPTQLEPRLLVEPVRVLDEVVRSARDAIARARLAGDDPADALWEHEVRSRAVRRLARARGRVCDVLERTVGEDEVDALDDRINAVTFWRSVAPEPPPMPELPEGGGTESVLAAARILNQLVVSIDRWGSAHADLSEAEQVAAYARFFFGWNVLERLDVARAALVAVLGAPPDPEPHDPVAAAADGWGEVRIARAPADEGLPDAVLCTVEVATRWWSRAEPGVFDDEVPDASVRFPQLPLARDRLAAVGDAAGEWLALPLADWRTTPFTGHFRLAADADALPRFDLTFAQGSRPAAARLTVTVETERASFETRMEIDNTGLAGLAAAIRATLRDPATATATAEGDPTWEDVRTVVAGLQGLRILHPAEAALVTGAVVERYVADPGATWWWDAPRDGIDRRVVEYGDDATNPWETLIEELVPPRETYVLIVSDERPDPPGAVEGTLEALAGLAYLAVTFEWILTTPDAAFALFDTHHDALVLATGG